MRIFKNAWFQRFARKEKISDQVLREAVGRAGSGVIDADLGGGLIKLRVARPGAGKSGGYRTLISSGQVIVRFLRSASPRATAATSMMTMW